jgi:hypothetical protein
VFEIRVLRRTFGPKRKSVESGDDCIMRSFVICMFHQVNGAAEKLAIIKTTIINSNTVFTKLQ